MATNEITDTNFFIPKNVDYAATVALQASIMDITLSCSITAAGARLISEGWTFYAVNQKRGRCWFTAKIITIPIFALVKTLAYKQWYVAHEISHAVAAREYKCFDHGQDFMAILHRICPPDAIHYELGYKPRNASAAGIFDTRDI